MRGPRAAQAWPSPQEQNPRGGRDRGHRWPRRLSAAAAAAAAATTATLASSSATTSPPIPIPAAGSGTTASAPSSLSSARHAIPRRVRSRFRFFLFFIILFITSSSFQCSTSATTARNEHLFFPAPGLLSRTGARWCQQHLPAVAAIVPLPLPSLPSERRRATPVSSALPVPLPPRDGRSSVPSVSGTAQAQPPAAVSFFVSTTRPGADHQRPHRRPKRDDEEEKAEGESVVVGGG